jgi:isoleucyl-tRNA synthetase
MAEELYRKLTGGESVHLLDWLPAGHVNAAMLSEMQEVREYVTQALAIRAQSGIKVRQPLALLSVPHLGEFVDYRSILMEEVNVKAVELGSQIELDVHVTESLRREGIAREIIRHVQGARKAAGLNIDDHIQLSLETSSKQILTAITEHRSTIMGEVLANAELSEGGRFKHVTEASIEGEKLTITLERSR